MKMANIVEAQQRQHKVVEERAKRNHEGQRQAASRGQLPNFAVGNYVMAARVRKRSSTLELVSTWTSTASRILSRAKFKDARVVHFRFYADKDLELTVALKEVFQHAFTQAEVEMAGIVDISEAKRTGFSRRGGLGCIRRGREFVGAACENMGRRPAALKSELKRLRLDRGVRLRLQKFYSMTL